MINVTDNDERLIQSRFADLMEHCAPICKSEQDRELIERAFSIANDAHRGIKRRSGEPYITHPIAVAKIAVTEIGLGVKSVVSALLHDVVEDTELTVEDIDRMFGPKIAYMVDGLTKMAGVFANESSEQAESFRKMLLTLSDDVRVILIKIADRLHNMRTLGAMPADKQMKIAGETLFLFAPLAHRLGLNRIKTEFENLSLRYMFPKEYNDITSKLNEGAEKRGQYIDKFIAPLSQTLREHHFDCEITGRIKSPYSIWEKMQRKGIPFEEIYDIFAIRIVFTPHGTENEKQQCLNIYSIITDIYKLKPDRFRDWVNIPKANGYEAIHCTVMGPEGRWVEIQIRSHRMDDIAEHGFAAHWKYKEEKVKSGEEGELDNWINEVREALNSPTENAVEFLDNFKLSLYYSDIVAFTPKGDQKRLPQGATALDFAYAIHSKVGNRAIGAKVNHKIDSIFAKIVNGDQVEIITSAKAEPKAEWLDHVVTARAKQHIKAYLKKENDNNIQRGMEQFEAELKKFNVTPSARVFRKVLPAYKCVTKDEFYSKLGAGIINIGNLEKVLKENTANKLVKYWGLQLTSPIQKLFGGGKKNGRPRPADGNGAAPQSFVIATCCNPIPGDQITGFIDDHNVVTVHKKNCPVAIKLSAQKGNDIVTPEWASHTAMSYLSHIRLQGIDRMGILQEISGVITTQLNVNIRKVYIESHDGIFEGVISLYVKDTKDLSNVISEVLHIKGVESVRRVESDHSENR